MGPAETVGEVGVERVVADKGYHSKQALEDLGQVSRACGRQEGVRVPNGCGTFRERRDRRTFTGDKVAGRSPVRGARGYLGQACWAGGTLEVRLNIPPNWAEFTQPRGAGLNRSETK